MADPVENPTVWSKEHHAYLEKHGVYDILQELMKELVIWKPEDPLQYMVDEIDHIVNSVYSPRVFIVGQFPESWTVGQKIAEASGSKFLTVDHIIEESPPQLKERLQVFIEGRDVENDDALRQLYVETIASRLDELDCLSGYVLCGFPQTKIIAQYSQQWGLLPRQVFVLLPEDKRRQPDDHEPTELELASLELNIYRDFNTLRDVATAYNIEICKAIYHERWFFMDRAELESELMGALITRRPTGAPWIPRILIIGPPASGKSSVAEYLATKYQIVNADWIDMVRGASLWVDDVSHEAQQYLIDLEPMSDGAIEKIIERKLGREDCQKKGWILQGFPETQRNADLLDRISFAPNRVFILNCLDGICALRMSKKQKAIMKRELPGLAPRPNVQLDTEHNVGAYPYSDHAIKVRCSRYNANIEDIVNFYDNAINVDATNNIDNVRYFVEASLLHPPTKHFR